jgi:lipoprotein-anchoring transpeptidase ErfK/SrfK
MMRFVRRSFVCAGAILFATGCTELPPDIGVHRHPRVATRTRRAALAPIVAIWQDDSTARGNPRIVVNLTTQQASFYRGRLLIGRTTISSGRREFETPPGKYRVIEKDADHISSQYGSYVSTSGAVLVRGADRNRDPVPRGAHFVGTPMPYFLRFTEGYGMHAGYVPQFRASHGCVRLPPEMAKHFFEAAEIGTRVEVIEPPPKVDE